ncbi:MAG: hypothetical protein K6U80_14470 [Firmicutes bacterium]|nr:hypothetical protein [Bacillota bacterium]
MRKYWGTITGALLAGLLGEIIVQAMSPALGWPGNWGGFAGGMTIGLLAGRYLWKRFQSGLDKITGQELLIKALSLFVGLGIALIINIMFRPFLEGLPAWKNCILMFSSTFLSIAGSLSAGSAKSKELSALLFNTPHPLGGKNGKSLKIIDTSAIIDGRIADLCKTGFLEGVLIVPSFILAELQKIADSTDPIRRNRGRRGLDLLNKIQKENQVSIRIFDRDYEELNDVDTKILRLARELEAKVLTNDFNLNKIAELYGVQVLNINELSNAIKLVVLPGEEMVVHVLRDGKEYGQGIGYLMDGTMIVIEGGKNYIGADIEIFVTSVLQTAAGRMIFAKPKEYMVSKATC